jgi:hypothetical protein
VKYSKEADLQFIGVEHRRSDEAAHETVAFDRQPITF